MYSCQINVFRTGIRLPGRSEVSQAVAGPCWLQLCAVVWGSGNKKTSYYHTFRWSVLPPCLGFRSPIKLHMPGILDSKLLKSVDATPPHRSVGTLRIQETWNVWPWRGRQFTPPKRREVFHSRHVENIPGDARLYSSVSQIVTMVQILYNLHSSDTPFKFRSVAIFLSDDVLIYHVIFASFSALTVAAFTSTVLTVRPQRNERKRTIPYYSRIILFNCTLSCLNRRSSLLPRTTSVSQIYWQQCRSISNVRRTAVFLLIIILGNEKS